MLAILFALAVEVSLKSFQAAEDAYLKQGRADRMLELANRMLQRPNDPNIAAYLHARGLAYSQMHLPEPAWQALEQALPLAEKSGDLAVLGAIHRDRAIWIWRFQRDRARASREFDAAIACGRRAGAWFIVTSSLHTSANMFADDPGEARRRLEEALVIARREHTGTAHILLHLGSVYRELGDVRRAATAYEEALAEADRHGVGEVRWEARDDLGVLLNAEHYFVEALDLLEAHQNEVALADFRPSVLAGAVMWSNPYDHYIDFLLRRDRAAEAFFVAERARARAFLATLSASRDASTAEERHLVERIKTAQAVLRSDALADAKRADVVASIGRYESQLSDLRLKLAVEHPSLAHARFPMLLRAADVQSRLLGPDESLVAFYLGGRQSVAWVVTRERIRTIALPPSPDIERLARAALDSLRNPTARDRQSIDALSRALQIDAILNAAGKPRVVIIPHGVLYDVPFEALVDSRGHAAVERCAVSYAPSASSLAFLRSVPHRNSPVSLIAVANPIVGAQAAAAVRQSDLAHVNLLAPLPQTSQEAKDIGASIVLEGANATRSELARLSEARVIHFATHGLIDESRPERSGLVLTADPPHDDGLLQVRDIYALHLNADLVTLSACQTALGENVTGEGVLGLTRAFFFAGARSVVASLWDVDDAATARFMQHFYSNLGRGEPIDVALQRAKLESVRAGEPPFVWASFVASGNARPAIASPAGFERRLAAILMVGIAVLSYFAIVKI